MYRQQQSDWEGQQEVHSHSRPAVAALSHLSGLGLQERELDAWGRSRRNHMHEDHECGAAEFMRAERKGTRLSMCLGTGARNHSDQDREGSAAESATRGPMAGPQRCTAPGTVQHLLRGRPHAPELPRPTEGDLSCNMC